MWVFPSPVPLRSWLTLRVQKKGARKEFPHQTVILICGGHLNIFFSANVCPVKAATLGPDGAIQSAIRDLITVWARPPSAKS